jgi:formate hydrogenlyase subunit 3/multisubunit Na+/H+ antiporter MnhD subunit
MINGSPLLALALAVPAVLLLACVSRGLRGHMPALLWLAPLPAAAAALFAGDGALLQLGNDRLRLTFLLDRPGAVLLGVAALLWIAAGIYAASFLRGRTDDGRFVVCWLLTLTGCVGVFLAADMVGFYFLLAVLSVGASTLVIQDLTPQAWRASAVYLGLALLAEAFLLGAFVLLAQAMPGGSVLIRDAAAVLPDSPWRDLTLALLILGFGMKAGLVPFHFWMPLAYGAAPTPAAAVLSGAVVKASILGLIRFLPLHVAMPGWGEVLATVGLFAALYGVAVGITQRNPRAVLAYSSVSQMGFILGVIGMGLIAGDAGIALLVAFYAAHHVLVKGGLFLAVGVASATGPQRVRPTLIVAAVIALGIAGLPLTGGALAKLAVKPPLGDGLAYLVATISSIASALLMLHFVRRLAANAAPDPQAAAPAGQSLPWLATAAASIAIPWILYLALPIGAWSDALDAKALWSGLWPVLVGAALAVGFARLRERVPRVPEGDVVVVVDCASRASVGWGAAVERGDAFLRRWVVAGLSLLTLAIVLGAAMLAAR